MATRNPKQSKSPKTKRRPAPLYGNAGDQQRRFLRALFSGKDSIIDIRVAQPDGPMKRTPCVGVDAALAEVRLGVDGGCNVYAGISSRADSSSAEKKGGKANLKESRAVFIDVDFEEAVNQ